jgi:D-alanyl-D-alanine carboxypeptidase
VKRSILAVAALVAVVVSSVAEAAAPSVQARAYVVQSSVDGHTLAARDADTPRAMASLTKLMTALVAVRRLELDQTVSVPAAATRIGESSVSLRPGQRVTVRDLVIATLVPSANDAATALAIAAAGDVRRFVAAMNREATRLGLAGTRYRNPHGLDEAGHVSTARDTAVLLREALRVPVLRRYAGTAAARLSNGRWVRSTDNLLGTFRGFVAGKTGHTSLAGWSQVGFARRGGVGITVTVLGAPSEAQRDTDLASLLRFGLESYRDSRVVDPSRAYARVALGWGRPRLPVVAPRAIVRPTPTGRPLTEHIVVPEVLGLPVAAGQRVGTLVVRDGRRVVARSPLVAGESRAEPSRAVKAVWLARRAGHNLVELVTP